jgi:hypothetical protein
MIYIELIDWPSECCGWFWPLPDVLDQCTKHIRVKIARAEEIGSMLIKVDHFSQQMGLAGPHIENIWSFKEICRSIEGVCVQSHLPLPPSSQEISDS